MSVHVAIQVKAKGDRIYIWCTGCDHAARSWSTGEAVTVPQIMLAEQQHRDAFHPQPRDYSGIYDGVYENGLG